MAWIGKLLGEEGGGLHFVGTSSIGKTTLLRIAGRLLAVNVGQGEHWTANS